MKTRSIDSETVKLIVYGVILVLLIGAGLLSQQPIPTEGVVSTYECDYKVMSLRTNIATTDSTGKSATIEGNILALFEDPLTMKDSSGNIICYAGDAYNFITQNNHGIYKNDEFLFNVDGEFKILADSYTVYDANGNEIAFVRFNMHDTVGKMYDANNTLIAQYNSGMFRKDYTVTIFEANEFDEDAIQMIFASYVSDKEADSN